MVDFKLEEFHFDLVTQVNHKHLALLQGLEVDVGLEWALLTRKSRFAFVQLVTHHLGQL
jgi:hypothetical protein